MSLPDDNKRKRESFSSSNSSGYIPKKNREGLSSDDSDIISGSNSLLHSTTNPNMSAIGDSVSDQQSISGPAVVIQPPSPLNIPPLPLSLSNHGSHNTQLTAMPSTSRDQTTPNNRFAPFDPSDPALKAVAQLPGSPDRNVKVIADLLNSSVSSFESIVRRDIAENNAILIDQFKSDFAGEIATEVYNGLKHEMQVENDELRGRCARLERDMVSLKQNSASMFEIMSKKVVEHDQSSRRLNMRIHGFKEYPDENVQYLKHLLIDIVAQRLQIYIRDHDIESIYRVGNRQPGRSRSILCKFARSDAKAAIIGNRKYLKGSGISFSEDLCPDLQEIHDSVKGHINIQGIWAWNGKVQAKDKYNKIHTLTFGTDWLEFFDKLKPPGHTHSTNIPPRSTASQYVPPVTSSSPEAPTTASSITTTTAAAAAAVPSLHQTQNSNAPQNLPTTTINQPAATTTLPTQDTGAPSIISDGSSTTPVRTSASAISQAPAGIHMDIGNGFHTSTTHATTTRLYPNLGGMGAPTMGNYVQPRPSLGAEASGPQQPAVFNQGHRGPEHDPTRHRPRPQMPRTPDFRGMRPARNSTPHPRNIPPWQPLLQGYFQPRHRFVP